MFQKGNRHGVGGKQEGAGNYTDRFRHLCLRAIEEDNQIETLRKLARGKKAGTKEDPKVRDQIAAIEFIWDRALGKSEQVIHTNEREERHPAAIVDAALRSVEHFNGRKEMDK